MIKELQGKAEEVQATVINRLFPMLPGTMTLDAAHNLLPVLMASYELGYQAACIAHKPTSEHSK